MKKIYIVILSLLLPVSLFAMESFSYNEVMYTEYVDGSSKDCICYTCGNSDCKMWVSNRNNLQLPTDIDADNVEAFIINYRNTHEEFTSSSYIIVCPLCGLKKFFTVNN